jgi:uncharacterized radical SAM superfamily protein
MIAIPFSFIERTVIVSIVSVDVFSDETVLKKIFV